MFWLRQGLSLCLGHILAPLGDGGCGLLAPPGMPGEMTRGVVGSLSLLASLDAGPVYLWAFGALTLLAVCPGER